MPTYRNNTDTPINYNSKGKLYSFPPHKDYPARIWVPYQELGLELVNPDYPPVPESLMLSGTFNFGAGIERKFSFEHCDSYSLRVQVKSGKVKLYTGSSRVGAEIEGSYDTVLQWEKAPYIRIAASKPSEVRIDAEMVE